MTVFLLLLLVVRIFSLDLVTEISNKANHYSINDQSLYNKDHKLGLPYSSNDINLRLRLNHQILDQLSFTSDGNLDFRLTGGGSEQNNKDSAFIPTLYNLNANWAFWDGYSLKIGKYYDRLDNSLMNNGTDRYDFNGNKRREEGIYTIQLSYQTGINNFALGFSPKLLSSYRELSNPNTFPEFRFIWTAFMDGFDLKSSASVDLDSNKLCNLFTELHMSYNLPFQHNVVIYCDIVPFQKIGIPEICDSLRRLLTHQVMTLSNAKASLFSPVVLGINTKITEIAESRTEISYNRYNLTEENKKDVLNLLETDPTQYGTILWTREGNLFSKAYLNESITFQLLGNNLDVIIAGKLNLLDLSSYVLLQTNYKINGNAQLAFNIINNVPNGNRSEFANSLYIAQYGINISYSF